MVDLRVVNDFADNKKTAIFKDFARGIRQIDRALDPVAKTKLLRQAHGRVAHGDDSTRRGAPSRQCRCGNAIRPVAAPPPSRRAYAGSLSPALLCRWKSDSCSYHRCHSERSEESRISLSGECRNSSQRCFASYNMPRQSAWGNARRSRLLRAAVRSAFGTQRR